MELFRAYGVTSAMVNLGGNIQILGTTPEGTPWRIGVRDPESATGGALAVIPASDMAVVTSGGYERFFEVDGQRYIHILDPRTGRPAATDLLSATVLASDGILADALSTAVFVMGVEEATAFWRERSGSFELVLVDTSGTLYVTEGLEKVIKTSRPVTVIRP